MSVARKCLRTVEPKLPVPPVITRVLPLNASVILFILILAHLFLSSTENIEAFTSAGFIVPFYPENLHAATLKTHLCREEL